MNNRIDLTSNGIYRIRARGTDMTLANVRLEYNDEGLTVYIQETGEGDWEENPEAFGLLFGDAGAVERIA